MYALRDTDRCPNCLAKNLSSNSERWRCDSCGYSRAWGEAYDPPIVTRARAPQAPESETIVTELTPREIALVLLGVRIFLISHGTPEDPVMDRLIAIGAEHGVTLELLEEMRYLHQNFLVASGIASDESQ